MTADVAAGVERGGSIKVGEHVVYCDARYGVRDALVLYASAPSTGGLVTLTFVTPEGQLVRRASVAPGAPGEKGTWRRPYPSARVPPESQPENEVGRRSRPKKGSEDAKIGDGF